MTFQPKSGSPLVVAFCGLKGHGKDTGAQVLIDKYGFTRVSFADGLRKTVCTALRVDESYFLDPATKEEIDPRTGKSRRYWLQWVGTEGFRSIWDNVWVEWWKQEVLAQGYERVVTTDLRFPNEMKYVRDFGGYVINVSNPRIPPSGDLHASEVHANSLPADLRITNSGSIADLHSAVEDVATSVLGLSPVRSFPLWRND